MFVFWTILLIQLVYTMYSIGESRKYMSKQSENGKAFEYACLSTLNNLLSSTQEVLLNKDEAFATAKKDFESINPDEQKNMSQAAKAGMELLFKFEPILQNPLDESPLTLSIQKDVVARGQNADVRDVVCSREEDNWEIGFSCKHNHDAVKHSRISPKIDFGAEWLGEKCSDEYWTTVRSVFNKLAPYKGIAWADVTDINKENDVYIPLLEAFMKELIRICETGEQRPSNLLSYLLGGKDFYKIIQRNKNNTTDIEVFNLNNTLGKPSGSTKPRMKVIPPILPTKLFELDFLEKNGQKSTNTVIANFNHGWSIKFRIHNASSRVETSMKFDIALLSLPSDMQKQTIFW